DRFARVPRIEPGEHFSRGVRGIDGRRIATDYAIPELAFLLDQVTDETIMALDIAPPKHLTPNEHRKRTPLQTSHGQLVLQLDLIHEWRLIFPFTGLPAGRG